MSVNYTDISGYYFKGFFLRGMLLFSLFFIFSSLQAQVTKRYLIEFTSNDVPTIELAIDFDKAIYYDSTEIVKLVNTKLMQLQKQGYIYSSIDSIRFLGKVCHVFIFKGNRYSYEVYYDSTLQDYIEQSAFSTKKWSSAFVDSVDLGFFSEGVVNELANRGYPFANVTTSVVPDEEFKVNIQLSLHKGSLIKYDKIILPDSVGTNPAYISRVLNLVNGKIYVENDIKQIRSRLKNLSFLEINQAPTLRFSDQYATVLLPIKNRKASKFDFIIGVLPGNDGTKRTWTINGEFNGEFINKFGQGERLSLVFKRLSLEDQLLTAAISYPFLFNSPFGFSTDFELKRNRNISVDLNSNIGGQMIINSTNQLKLFWTYRSSRLIEIDAAKILASKRLPKNLDFNYSGGGVEYTFRNLDYIFNPRRGMSWRLTTGVGSRSILKNQTIQELKNEITNFESAYDSIKLNNVQFNISSEFDHFLPISNWASLKNGLRMGMIYNNGKIIENELFRIGGNRLLRGFDELSLFTDRYFVYTSEFRILLDVNSYLNFPFIDVAFIQNKLSVTPNKYTPAIGIGMGMNFSTKAGIFNISFAAGNYDFQGFDFANTKIHFGYLNLF